MRVHALHMTLTTITTIIVYTRYTTCLKSASKYLCLESDQKGPLIYALNLTEKAQRASKYVWVESHEKGL